MKNYKLIKYRHKIAKQIGGYDSQKMAEIDNHVEQNYIYDNYGLAYKKKYHELRRGGAHNISPQASAEITISGTKKQIIHFEKALFIKGDEKILITNTENGYFKFTKNDRSTSVEPLGNDMKETDSNFTSKQTSNSTFAKDKNQDFDAGHGLSMSQDQNENEKGNDDFVEKQTEKSGFDKRPFPMHRPDRNEKGNDDFVEKQTEKSSFDKGPFPVHLPYRNEKGFGEFVEKQTEKSGFDIHKQPRFNKSGFKMHEERNEIERRARRERRGRRGSRAPRKLKERVEKKLKNQQKNRRGEQNTVTDKQINVIKISPEEALDLELKLNKSPYDKTWKKLGDVFFEWRLDPESYSVDISNIYKITMEQYQWIKKNIMKSSNGKKHWTLYT